MPDFISVQNQVWDLFARPTPPLMQSFNKGMMTMMPWAPAAIGPTAAFSPFDPDHVEDALRTADELMRLADSAPGSTGLQLAADEFSRRLESGAQSPELVYYAMQVFITHHPNGRLLSGAIPPLAVREGDKVAPSRAPDVAPASAPGADPAAAAAVPSPSGGVLPQPDGLEWYREDPFANEHHEHWHVVYPTAGIPDRKGGRKAKDRHGELFFYMHQQMLARYDVERIAVGLPRVLPFAYYRDPIEEGYDPGVVLSQSYGRREPNTRLRDITDPAAPFSLADLETRRDRLARAVETGAFEGMQPPLPVTMDRLGATVEPNLATVSPGGARNLTFYGNLHGMGHALAARVNAPGLPVEGARSGVMQHPATAIRDPFFYRWHKHIDDLGHAAQQKLPPHDFSDHPYVALRKTLAGGDAVSPDLILAFEDAIPAEHRRDVTAWGSEAFGGDWDADFSGDARTTARLETQMVRRTLRLSDRVTEVQVEHLVHRPFVWFLRVQNQLRTHVTVTVRLFLVPVELVEDRRMWMELDKFLHELAPLERAVIARRGSESAVIRKPAEMQPRLRMGFRLLLTDAVQQSLREAGVPPEVVAKLEPLVGNPFDDQSAFFAQAQGLLTAAEFQQHALAIYLAARLDGEKPVQPFLPDGSIDPLYQEAQNYCTCGWPYSLLLPRGKAEAQGGMRFRLAAVLTDWNLDRVGPEGCCGSVSYCGAIDQYPDKRAMGYPFDRPFELGIMETLRSLPNTAFRDVTIVHTAGGPEIVP